MKHEYVCRECEEPCVLTICLKADTIPDECPWGNSQALGCLYLNPPKAKWVDLEKSENNEREGLK